MRVRPRLADAHTNPKVLSSDKIGTIQRRLVRSQKNDMHKSRNSPNINLELMNELEGSIDAPAGNVTVISHEKQQKLTKLLLNVHIQNSLGPIHVVMSPDNTVGDLIKAAIEIYTKDKRRPLLPNSDPWCYELHYSQFSLESLKPEKKLVNLESRSFFLCPKPNCSINSSCKDKAKATAKFPLLLTKFVDLLS